VKLIVAASDYVGLKIIEFLSDRRAEVGWLILDPKDRGGHNSKIVQAYRKGTRGGAVEEASALKNPKFVSSLSRSRLRLGILAWWPYLLRGKVLTVPALGWVNLHPAYLPYNRGKHPNFWCLVDGTPPGVTLHAVDRGIDTGPVLAQKGLEIGWEDTGETVYKKLRDLAVDLFREVYERMVSDGLPRVPQPKGAGSFHASHEIEDVSRIALDAPTKARQLFNVSRARMFPPHPTA